MTNAERIAASLNGAEISEKLFFSQHTVQTHVSHALTKLNLRTRVKLAATVARRKLPLTPTPTQSSESEPRPQLSR
ncbi:LuxR C-terminal-related transcriptional regulator [Rhodococcus qingshengii]|uniref:LuxR C-terminal-related transcriptional regulator n=1 Tax=Rhodococcus qingshengii TaxID=334542 RepID=UPI0036DDB6CC